MPYNIGLNILEVTGNTTSPLVGSSTSVAGFVILAEKGFYNEPTRVNSWGEFEKNFGSLPKDPSSKIVGPFAVKGFFENGGSEAWIVRVEDNNQSTTEIFPLFDNCSIQMLAYPDNNLSAVTDAGITYCATRNDCVYIASIPIENVQEQKKETTNVKQEQKKENTNVKQKLNLNIASVNNLRKAETGASYGVLYAPYIQVPWLANTTNALKEIPPTGHVMGVYSRISSGRGIWKAPAGDEAGLRGVLGITKQYSDKEHTQMVKEYSINCIRFVPGAGIVIDSSRTLCTDSRWQYVGTRRLFNYVKSTLKDGLRWVRQESNRDSLWKKVKFNVIKPFLMALWQQGAFGTGKPEQVFTVKCDSDNNPPDQVDQGIFKVEVYFYPSKPAETIIIQVGQQDFGGSASEN